MNSREGSYTLAGVAYLRCEHKKASSRTLEFTALHNSQVLRSCFLAQQHPSEER